MHITTKWFLVTTSYFVWLIDQIVVLIWKILNLFFNSSSVKYLSAINLFIQNARSWGTIPSSKSWQISGPSPLVTQKYCSSFNTESIFIPNFDLSLGFTFEEYHFHLPGKAGFLQNISHPWNWNIHFLVKDFVHAKLLFGHLIYLVVFV